MSVTLSPELQRLQREHGAAPKFTPDANAELHTTAEQAAETLQAERPFAPEILLADRVQAEQDFLDSDPEVQQARERVSLMESSKMTTADGTVYTFYKEDDLAALVKQVAYAEAAARQRFAEATARRASEAVAARTETIAHITAQVGEAAVPQTVQAELRNLRAQEVVANAFVEALDDVPPPSPEEHVQITYEADDSEQKLIERRTAALAAWKEERDRLLELAQQAQDVIFENGNTEEGEASRAYLQTLEQEIANAQTQIDLLEVQLPQDVVRKKGAAPLRTTPSGEKLVHTVPFHEASNTDRYAKVDLLAPFAEEKKEVRQKPSLFKKLGTALMGIAGLFAVKADVGLMQNQSKEAPVKRAAAHATEQPGGEQEKPIARVEQQPVAAATTPQEVAVAPRVELPQAEPKTVEVPEAVVEVVEEKEKPKAETKEHKMAVLEKRMHGLNEQVKKVQAEIEKNAALRGDDEELNKTADDINTALQDELKKVNRQREIFLGAYTILRTPTQKTATREQVASIAKREVVVTKKEELKAEQKSQPMDAETEKMQKLNRRLAFNQEEIERVTARRGDDATINAAVDTALVALKTEQATIMQAQERARAAYAKSISQEKPVVSPEKEARVVKAVEKAAAPIVEQLQKKNEEKQPEVQRVHRAEKPKPVVKEKKARGLRITRAIERGAQGVSSKKEITLAEAEKQLTVNHEETSGLEAQLAYDGSAEDETIRATLQDLAGERMKLQRKIESAKQKTAIPDFSFPKSESVAVTNPSGPKETKAPGTGEKLEVPKDVRDLLAQENKLFEAYLDAQEAFETARDQAADLSKVASLQERAQKTEAAYHKFVDQHKR